MNYRDTFLNWYDSYKSSGHRYIKRMKDTFENSPHHRESSVMVHTDMVVENYIKFADEYSGGTWDSKLMQGAIACAFHDVGKPKAEETLTRDDGSQYRSYKTHEVLSGSYFHNCWCKNEFGLKDILDVNEFYNVWVMVVYHLPYNFSSSKVKIFKTHFDHFGITDVFCLLLKSDCHGRIQDDRETSLAANKEWIDHFKTIKPLPLRNKDNGSVEILCGVSGSGKSTYTDGKNAQVISLDGIRKALFPDAMSYNEVYTQCEAYFNDPKRDPMLIHDRLGIGGKHPYGFLETFLMLLSRLVKKVGKDELIIIDNTNTSMRRRGSLSGTIQHHHRKGVMFIRSLDELIENENNRPENEKRGVGVIYTMYFNLFPVLIGEVDELELIKPRKE